MDNHQNLFIKAIADDTRREIMERLCCVWMNVSDVVTALGGRVKQPTVSHHLSELADAGLVFVRQEGRQRYYTLNQQQVTLCCGQLFRAFNPGFDVQAVPLNIVPVERIDER